VLSFPDDYLIEMGVLDISDMPTLNEAVAIRAEERQ
jgi:hypothetical protein